MSLMLLLRIAPIAVTLAFIIVYPWSKRGDYTISPNLEWEVVPLSSFKDLAGKQPMEDQVITTISARMLSFRTALRKVTLRPELEF